MKQRWSKVLTLATAVLATTAVTAFANTPAQEVYTPESGVLDVVATATPTPPAPAPPEPDAAPVAAEDDAETAEAPATPATPDAPETDEPTASEQRVEAGSLPFTGLDAGLVALGGLLLVGLGIAIRRASAA